MAAPRTTAGSQRRRGGFAQDAILALVTFAAYAPSLRGGTIWDDEFLTTRNPYLAFDKLDVLLKSDLWIASAKEEASGYYRPLAGLSYAVNRWIGGNEAISYHAGNILLHVLVVIALHRLLRMLAPSRVAAPFALAAFFALAPVGSEAVCWLAGRFDLLATLFILLMIHLHARGRPILTALAFACAMLTKETSIVAPLILALYDVLHRRFRLSLAGVYASFAGIAIGYFALRHAVGMAPVGASVLSGAALRGWVWLVGLVLGATATITYPATFRAFHDPGWTMTAIGAGIIALVTLLLFVFRERARLRVVLFGWLWALAALTPVGLMSPRLAQIGDRYAYLALAGFAILATGLIDALSRRWRVLAWSMVAAIGMLTVVRVGMLESRIDDWHDEERFFTRELARDPSRYFAALLLGEKRAKEGRYEEAEALFLEARRMSWSYRVHVGLCYVYLNEERYAEAVSSCDRAIEGNPIDVRARVNHGHAELGLHHPKRALRDAAMAIEQKPSYAEAHFVRAIALAQLGDVASARQEAEIVLQLNPRHSGARMLASQLAEPRPHPPPRP